MSHINTPWYQHYDGVRPHLDYPDISIYQMLKNTAEKYPENLSYNYYGTKIKYRQFIDRIDRCAEAFLQLGIKTGERVSICMPNTPEAIISFYALNKIGAVANMIHPLSAEREIRYYLQVSKSRYIVAIDIAAEKINNVKKDTALQECILVSAKDSMPLWLKAAYQITKGRASYPADVGDIVLWKDFLALADDVGEKSADRDYHGGQEAAILYTGGTTGEPKGIVLSNFNFNALALQSIEACGCLLPGDKVLAIMPVFHGFGLGICIHTVQCVGGCSILLPQFQIETFDRLLKKYRPNIIAGVPTLYEAMLRNKKLAGYDLSFLKCVISGGDSLSVSLKQKIDRFLNEHHADIRVREGYGLTECVTGSCLAPVNHERTGSIGIPYPDMYYKIVSPGTEEELAAGEAGEIVLSGPTVMQGYLEDAEATGQVLRKHRDGLVWLHTGDLGHMDADGFIYFKQRIKRMIVSSGYSLSPQYIEHTMDAHPDILMSCAIGVDHSYKGQAVKVFLVLKDDGKDHGQVLESVKAYGREHLAKYSWPAEYEIREHLPKTLVGKIAYNQLMEEEHKKHEGRRQNNPSGTS